jgi:hypothetical protein
MPVQEWFYKKCSEFESTFNEYWHVEGAAGLSCTELSIWEFPFLRGGGGRRQWGNSTVHVYDIVWMGWPRRTSWKCCVHLYAFVSYQRLSPQFQFSLSAVTLVYLSQWLLHRRYFHKDLYWVELSWHATWQALSGSSRLGDSCIPIPDSLEACKDYLLRYSLVCGVWIIENSLGNSLLPFV